MRQEWQAPMDQPETAVAPTVSEPMVEKDTTGAFLVTAATTGVRQALLFLAGMAAAHGLVPEGLISDTQVQVAAGVVVAFAVTAWGQYKAAHRKSKLIVALDHVDDAIGRVIRKGVS